MKLNKSIILVEFKKFITNNKLNDIQGILKSTKFNMAEKILILDLFLSYKMFIIEGLKFDLEECFDEIINLNKNMLDMVRSNEPFFINIQRDIESILRDKSLKTKFDLNFYEVDVYVYLSLIIKSTYYIGYDHIHDNTTVLDGMLHRNVILSNIENNTKIFKLLNISTDIQKNTIKLIICLANSNLISKKKIIIRYKGALKSNFYIKLNLIIKLDYSNRIFINYSTVVLKHFNNYIVGASYLTLNSFIKKSNAQLSKNIINCEAIIKLSKQPIYIDFTHWDLVKNQLIEEIKQKFNLSTADNTSISDIMNELLNQINDQKLILEELKLTLNLKKQRESKTAIAAPNIEILNIKNLDTQTPNIEISNVTNPIIEVSSIKTSSIEIQNSKIQIPKTQNFEIQISKTQNPEIQNSNIQNSNIQNSKILDLVIQNSNILNLNMLNLKIANFDISNPEISNSKVSNPEILNSEIPNLKILKSEIPNPNMSNLEISNLKISSSKNLNSKTLDVKLPDVEILDIKTSTTKNAVLVVPNLEVLSNDQRGEELDDDFEHQLEEVKQIRSVTSGLIKEVQQLYYILAAEKAMNYTYPIYIPHYCDFRGRIYPKSIIGFTYLKTVRAFFKLPNHDLPVDKQSIIDSIYFKRIIKLNISISKKLLRNNISDINKYLMIIHLLELGKCDKSKIISVAGLSLQDFVDNGTDIFFKKKNLNIDLDDTAYVKTITTNIEHFLNNGEFNNITIIRDSTASFLQH
jgi:hypothetical protein